MPAFSVFKQTFFTASLALAVAACSVPHLAVAQTAPKVLMVVSSHGQDQGKTRPGFELDEFALAYMVFKANGLDVEVASPKGGKVEPDKFNPKREQVVAFQSQPSAATLFDNTTKLSDVKADGVQAVFVAGGKGAMFDLATDPHVGKLLAGVHARGGVASALCHGVAALAMATQANGQPFVAGKRVTGFTNEEEAEFGKRWVKEFPYLVETKLREQGAHWQEAGLMLPHTVVDGRLVTGQNPFSTADVAEQVVSLLGRKPVARTLFQEEATMKLGLQHFEGGAAAVAEAVNANPKRYHMEMLGYLGYVNAKSAATRDQRKQALALMLLVQPHTTNPRIGVAVAEIQTLLGERDLARQQLTQVLAKHPDFADAKAAMAAL